MGTFWTSRHRQRGQYTVKAEFWTRGMPISCSNRTWSPWVITYSPSPIAGTISGFDDNPTPGYWKRVKKHEWIPPSVFDGSQTIKSLFGWTDYMTGNTLTPSCTNPDLYGRTEYAGNRIFTKFPYSSGAVGLLDTGGRSDLVGQTVTKVMAERGSGTANYVESLAEMDQLYHMLANPFENGHKFVSDFRKADSYRLLQSTRNSFPGWEFVRRGVKLSKPAKAWLKLLASEWLRFRYGISPVMSDVKAGLKTLSKEFDSGSPKRHKSRSTGTMHAQDYQRLTFVGGVYTEYTKSTYTDTFSVNAYWYDEYRKSAFNELGLSLHNLIAVPWELTRLSFVVDWFVNVGDVIYANIPRVGFHPLGGAYGTRRDIVTTHQGDGIIANTAGYVVEGSFSDGVKIQSIEKSRRPIDTTSNLVVKSDFRLSNWIRATDALTLLVNQLGRLRFH